MTKQKIQVYGTALFEVMLEKREEYLETFWVDPREHFKVLLDNLPRLDKYEITGVVCQKIKKY